MSGSEAARVAFRSMGMLVFYAGNFSTWCFAFLLRVLGKLGVECGVFVDWVWWIGWWRWFVDGQFLKGNFMQFLGIYFGEIWGWDRRAYSRG
jgi:hypothetical protein